MKKQYNSAQLTIVALRSNDIIATSTFDVNPTGSLSSINGYSGKSYDGYSTKNGKDIFDDEDDGPVSIIW